MQQNVSLSELNYFQNVIQLFSVTIKVTLISWSSLHHNIVYIFLNCKITVSTFYRQKLFLTILEAPISS